MSGHKPWKDIKHKAKSEEPEEKEVVGKRTPREQIACPECGEKAERQRNGDWVCLNFEKITLPSGGTLKILQCGARGVTFEDGELGVSQGGIRPVEDTSLPNVG